MLGYGTGPDDLGRRIKQAQASALRSERRAITAEGAGSGARVSEERDGIETVTRIEQDAQSDRSGEPANERTTTLTPSPTRTLAPSYRVISPTFD